MTFSCFLQNSCVDIGHVMINEDVYRGSRIIWWFQIMLSLFSRNSWISWKFSLHIVYIFKMAWSFWTELWHFERRFNRNIFKPLSAHVHLAIIYQYRVFTNLKMDTIDDVINVVTRLFLQILSDVQLLLEMSTSTHTILLSSMMNLSNITIKLKFRRNKFGKRIVYNLHARIHF